jgi:hypothetical protein
MYDWGAALFMYLVMFLGVSFCLAVFAGLGYVFYFGFHAVHLCHS